MFKELLIKECHDIRSLSDHISSLKCSTDLSYLQSIDRVYLQKLDDFSVLFRGERGESALTPTPPGMFSCLKYIEIKNCPKMKKIVLHNLHYLEDIYVSDYEQLVKIIAALDDDGKNK